MTVKKDLDFQTELLTYFGYLKDLKKKNSEIYMYAGEILSFVKKEMFIGNSNTEEHQHLALGDIKSNKF